MIWKRLLWQEIGYCNADRIPVDKDSATLIFITEFDRNDVEINQIWGTANKQG